VKSAHLGIKIEHQPVKSTRLPEKSVFLPLELIQGALCTVFNAAVSTCSREWNVFSITEKIYFHRDLRRASCWISHDRTHRVD
jgi:hypothetical protein